MRILLAFVVAVSLLFVASDCKRVEEEDPPKSCKKIWSKVFRPDVIIDTTDHLKIIVPDSLSPGNNAVLIQDSINGDFNFHLIVSDFNTGKGNGAYFRLVINCGDSGKLSTISANIFSYSDSFSGPQIAAIIDSSGKQQNGIFSDYKPIPVPSAFQLYAERRDSVAYCGVIATSSSTKTVNKTMPFNKKECKLLLELGSNNGIVKDTVSIKLVKLIARDSKRDDNFDCNSIK